MPVALSFDMQAPHKLPADGPEENLLDVINGIFAGLC